jgi:hypothetical protein
MPRQLDRHQKLDRRRNLIGYCPNAVGPVPELTTIAFTLDARLDVA